MNRAFLTDIKELRRRARSHEEQGHADVIAERIVQLGGAPDMNPDASCSGAIRSTSRARTWST